MGIPAVHISSYRFYDVDGTLGDERKEGEAATPQKDEAEKSSIARMRRRSSCPPEFLVEADVAFSSARCPSSYVVRKRRLSVEAHPALVIEDMDPWSEIESREWEEGGVLQMLTQHGNGA